MSVAVRGGVAGNELYSIAGNPKTSAAIAKSTATSLLAANSKSVTQVRLQVGVVDELLVA